MTVIHAIRTMMDDFTDDQWQNPDFTAAMALVFDEAKRSMSDTTAA